MNKHAIALVFVLGVSSSSAEEPVYDLNYKPANAVYVIFGQDIAEPARPTKHDSKIAFSVSGQVAKDMFEAMPPDREIKCTDDETFRFRSRDHERLVCTHYQGDYTCSFGFDLKTGKSVGGGNC